MSGEETIEISDQDRKETIYAALLRHYYCCLAGQQLVHQKNHRVVWPGTLEHIRHMIEELEKDLEA